MGHLAFRGARRLQIPRSFGMTSWLGGVGILVSHCLRIERIGDRRTAFLPVRAKSSAALAAAQDVSKFLLKTGYSFLSVFSQAGVGHSFYGGGVAQRTGKRAV
jgi:hypothetical protein